MRKPFAPFVIYIVFLGLIRASFGFGLGGGLQSPLPVVPLSAIAPSPFPFPSLFPSAFPSPFASPFPSPFAFPPPVLVLAPSFAPAPFFPPPFPAFGSPPAPYPPHYGLAAALLNLILAKKGKFLPPPYPYPPPPPYFPPPPPPPPPPSYPYPPQATDHVLNVHITKDNAGDKKHHDWHNDKPKWD